MKEGDIIDIFFDPKFEKEFEGSAKLISLKEELHSFIDSDEKLYTQLEDRAIGANGAHLPLTKTQEKNNLVYSELLTYFEGTPSKKFVHPEIRILKDTLVKLAEKKTIEARKKMLNILLRHRFEWRRSIEVKSWLFRTFSDEQIADFMFQRYAKNWTHSIWREERWLVEFIPDQYSLKSKYCLFNNPFRTIRKVRKLLCLCPEEENQSCELSFYTTDSRGLSGSDKKALRSAKKEDEDEDDY